MSFKTEDEEHKSDLEVLLAQVIKQLKLLNARVEEAFETKIIEEDIE